MDKLLLHPTTQRVLDQALAGTHHALALIGPQGAGKATLALAAAQQLLGVHAMHPQALKRLKPTNASISIEDIRDLKHFLHLKTTGKEEVRRVIIIEDAHMMTTEAQNALLKLLEEPPEDTRLILTLTQLQRILPTVSSRLQHILVRACTVKATLDYFTRQGYAPDEVEKAHVLSGGYAGLGAALLAPTPHPLKEAVIEAKTLLSIPVYERLLRVEALSKDREQIEHVLLALKRVLSSLVRQHPETPKQLQRLLQGLQAVHTTEFTILKNGNAKLALTDLLLHL